MDEKAIEIGIPDAICRSETAKEDLAAIAYDEIALGATDSRVLSKGFSESSRNPEPPPDGGWTAWSMCEL